MWILIITSYRFFEWEKNNQKAYPFVKSYFYFLWNGALQITPCYMKMSNEYLVFDVVNALGYTFFRVMFPTTLNITALNMG